MPRQILDNPCLKQPRKGINAEVLIDGFSPGPAKDTFDLDPKYSLVARYLLENQRGFMRAIPFAQFPKPSTIILLSEPKDAIQLRIAFGLTLLCSTRSKRTAGWA
jgi:hypothetical protein